MFARRGGHVRHFDGWLRRGRGIEIAPGVVGRLVGPWLIDNTMLLLLASLWFWLIDPFHSDHFAFIQASEK
eukprot:scaffold13059_cov155-Skeletonema_marinoi.AAC.1